MSCRRNERAVRVVNICKLTEFFPNYASFSCIFLILCMRAGLCMPLFGKLLWPPLREKVRAEHGSHRILPCVEIFWMNDCMCVLPYAAADDWPLIPGLTIPCGGFPVASLAAAGFAGRFLLCRRRRYSPYLTEVTDGSVAATCDSAVTDIA